MTETLDLQALYGTDSERVKLAFGTNNPSILERLGADTCIAVRVEVAGNENTDAKTLAMLAQDTEVSVRSQVAGNFNTDAPTIKKLLHDSNAVVREEASYSDHA